MLFKIENEIMKTGVYTCAVAVRGIDNTRPQEKILTMLREEVLKACSATQLTSVREMEALMPYRDAMCKLGINPNKYPCSVEAILTRISRKGDFPSINPIVDLGNYISIKYRLPVGVHDLGTIRDVLTVRLADNDDCGKSENHFENDELKPGEPVYAAGDSVRTRRWLWRQTPAGRVTEKSTDFLIPIDGFESNKETVDAACNELVALLRELFHADVEYGVLNRSNTEFYFGVLTVEEQDIENQIAIMLKGVVQHTPVSEIREKLREARKENRPLRIKLGLDPSAPDIHIGHSVLLRKIRQLQDLGHIAVIIIGDYTGMIGDPTGKSKTRKQLSREDVERNANTYMEQIFKIIDQEKTEVYYNSEWLSKMTFSDVIELAAKCTVARMLERDDFNNRYTNHLPLSVHEFFYPLMQAYDSVAIRADIELGGTDQTFNILMGRSIQKDYGQAPQLVLLMPLLEGIDGIEKMSKSLGNYIGISEEPSVIYEKVMKIPDNMIIKYYNLCTDVHPDEIARLQRLLEDGTNPRDIKMMLASEITGLYAGEDAARQAQEHFKAVFQQNQVPDDIPVIIVDTCSDIPQGEQILNALVAGKYFKSKSEARRVFMQGGVSLGDRKVTDVKLLSFSEDEQVMKIGKNKFFRITTKI